MATTMSASGLANATKPSSSRRTGNPSGTIRRRCVCQSAGQSEGARVAFLDYGAGNVRSVRNAIKRLGWTPVDVEKPADIERADRLVFPGVGSFGTAMARLQGKGLAKPLQEYIMSGKPFLGICLGLQLLFEGSSENGGAEGLGIIPGRVDAFPTSMGDDEHLVVPHMGWNTIKKRKSNSILSSVKPSDRLYFVHSYRAIPDAENSDWTLATCDYGGDFIAAVSNGNVSAVQFHPEKSSVKGLNILQLFLEGGDGVDAPSQPQGGDLGTWQGLGKRVIACLDVRANDSGDLVVTKGDSYDVREGDGQGGNVRNLGKPVDLSERYFNEGADEVTFLNITGFRDFPLGDLPMLEVMRQASERVFVPMTVGGGIRDFIDANGVRYSALDVAAEYFRSGADKVSIGSEAVDAAEDFIFTGKKTGKTPIEQISRVYGKQAVVVSIDPKRVYVDDPSSVMHKTVYALTPGPNGERFCWYQCTVKGGREARDIDAVELAQAVEALGAGEILLNCIDEDGQGNGYDLALVEAVASSVSIPVIASSGAGRAEHFSELFRRTRASAALAAGIFHRHEVEIGDAKSQMHQQGVPVRR